MNVWVCFPSVDCHKASLAKTKWRKQGYKVALFFDVDRESVDADRNFFGRYQGYWNACNLMARALVADEKADIVVFAADDIDPDPNHTAQEIAEIYVKRFPDFYGVLQPCADPQGLDASGKSAAARIAGSPWLGRKWITDAFGGKYPIPDEPFHFYSDELLKEVAERLGKLEMRPDLEQWHHHWSFEHREPANYQRRNSTFHWDKDKAWFMRHKAEDFKTYLEMFK